MNLRADMQQPAAAKSLQGLLAGLATVNPHDRRAVGGLSLDSRRVQPDDLFLAVPGEAVDGRDYIRQAVKNGAAAVAREKVCDAGDGADDTVPSFDIAGLKKHIGDIAARFYDHPSARMQLIGITGTNGKTTCAYLLAQALNLLGQRCGLMGTLGAGFIGDLQPSPLTTADAVATQRILAELLAKRAQAVCVEASSHGLAQGRLGSVAFDVAVLTNLSRDHLDYHGGMQQYAAAKQKLFGFDGLNSAVINLDDAFGRRLLNQHAAAQCIGYAVNEKNLRADGDVYARRVQLNENGIVLQAVYRGQCATIRSPLIGEVNVPNLLAVIATLLCCDYDLAQIAAIASEWRAPPGRMELLRNHASQPAVVVDYAHTPDALSRALNSLRGLCRGKLWVVFGCGGDRDAGKRAQMGATAESLADQTIITDDNPRGENPATIAAHIAAGMRADATVIHDRRRAIATAITQAAAEDMVLVAGKGHETTQTVGERVIALDDREVVAEILAGGALAGAEGKL